IIVLDAAHNLKAAYMVNYLNQNLKSNDEAEMLTMALGMSLCPDRTHILHGDNKLVVKTLETYLQTGNDCVTHQKQDGRSVTIQVPQIVKDVLNRQKSCLSGVTLRWVDRENLFIGIVDRIAGRAEFTAPGKLRQIPVLGSKPCVESLDMERVAPMLAGGPSFAVDYTPG
ncbi:MAG TPA: hypothetical protein PLO23_08085, partial [Alphaproteobacteria bacterium]|nr:hypothetical protein [Alphaproteobacteria bacterium]